MKISIAMIVRNEEKHLPRCLKSIEGLWDQLVIVDTGSMDQTIKIAKDFGAEVHQHPWEDNFAKHRNQSFSYATGNWILQIDADEDLTFQDRRTAAVLRNFLEHVPKDIHAIGIPMDDIVKGQIVATTQMVRLFRRGKVKYKRRIHNEPMFKGLVGLFTHARFRHYGYDLEDHERKSKAERTIGLLEEELKENPHDYDSMFYIAQAYSSFAQDLTKGLPWAEKYANVKVRKKMGIKFNKSVFYLLIIGYMKLDDLEKSWEWLQVAMKENPNDLDICMAMMRVGIHQQNLDLIGAGARAFVNKYKSFEKDRVQTASQFVFNYKPSSYAFALYQLTLTYLQHCAIKVTELEKTLDELDDKAMADELKAGVHGFLKVNKAIFEHNDALLQASETASTLYTKRPQPIVQRRQSRIIT